MSEGKGTAAVASDGGAAAGGSGLQPTAHSLQPSAYSLQPSADLPSAGRRRTVLSALLLATVMASLDSSFVPIAFPDMIDRLDTSTSVVVWVALGYLISATGLMLLSSRLSAVWGSDRVFQLGVAIYALAMVACTWAPDIRTLIALRVVQGAGMALFLPTTFSIATELYPASERGKALGIMQAGNAFGFVLGPIFAGWLLDAYDWRALFGSRIPLAGLAIVLSFVVTDARYRARAATRQSWDALGALLLTGTIFGLLFGLNRLPVEDNHRDALVWLVTAGGFVALYLFVRHELRAKDALIDLTLFTGNREFTRAAIAFTAYFASIPVQLFVLPLVLVGGLEMRPWDVGLTMAVIAVVTVVASPYAGKIADRFGAPRLAVTGCVLTALGYLALLPVSSAGGAMQLMPAMVLLGAGAALFFTPNNSLLMGNVPPRALVTAAGLIGVLRQSGYATGFAIVASLVTAIQDNLEEIWTAASVAALTDRTAEGLAFLFEEGGIWSPEVLIFVLRVTSLLGVLILALAIATSWPRLALRARSAAALAGTAVAAAIAAVIVVAAASGVPLSFADEDMRHDERAVAQVAAFGFVSRALEERAPESAAAGPALYTMHCAVCHGGDARGIAELGVSLVDSRFVRTRSPGDLVAFLKAGRMPDDPASLTGRPMPGFVFLEERELESLAQFLHDGAGTPPASAAARP